MKNLLRWSCWNYFLHRSVVWSNGSQQKNGVMRWLKGNSTNFSLQVLESSTAYVKTWNKAFAAPEEATCSLINCLEEKESIVSIFWFVLFGSRRISMKLEWRIGFSLE